MGRGLINALLERIESCFDSTTARYRAARVRQDRHLRSFGGSATRMTVQQRAGFAISRDSIELRGEYKKCLVELEAKGGRTFNIGIAQQQLGLLEYMSGNWRASKAAYEASLSWLELAMTTNRSTRSAIATSHFFLAHIGLKANDPAAALKHAQAALTIDRELEDIAAVEQDLELLNNQIKRARS